MWQTFYHRVSAEHQLAVTYAGNPLGIPVLFLHGGPGAGCKLEHFRYFDLKRYWVVLFDQRGSGRSLPFGSLIDNTSQDLIDDIEQLRRLFGVDRWLLFGGSWGSYLALAYAIHHPDRISGLVLRSICLGRPEEHTWLYQFGASELFTHAWQQFRAFIPLAEQDDLLKAYYQRLMSMDFDTQWMAAQQWSSWMMACLALPLPEVWPQDVVEKQRFMAQVRIEAHYYHHQLFFPVNFVCDQLPRLSAIPAAIVHGQHDFLCPPANAVILHQHLSQAHLTIVANAGHLSSAPGMFDALVESLSLVASQLCLA